KNAVKSCLVSRRKDYLSNPREVYKYSKITRMIKGLDFVKSCVFKVILRFLLLISDCERGAYFGLWMQDFQLKTEVKKNKYFIHISIQRRLGGWGLKYSIQN